MTEEQTPGRLAREKYTSMSTLSTQFALLWIVLFQKEDKQLDRNGNRHTYYEKVVRKGHIENKESNYTNQSYGHQKKINPFQNVYSFLCRHWPKYLPQFIDELFTLIFSHFFSAYKVGSRTTNTGTRSALLTLQARRFAYGSL